MLPASRGVYFRGSIIMPFRLSSLTDIGSPLSLFTTTHCSPPPGWPNAPFAGPCRTTQSSSGGMGTPVPSNEWYCAASPGGVARSASGVPSGDRNAPPLGPMRSRRAPWGMWSVSSGIPANPLCGAWCSQSHLGSPFGPSIVKSRSNRSGVRPASGSYPSSTLGGTCPALSRSVSAPGWRKISKAAFGVCGKSTPGTFGVGGSG